MNEEFISVKDRIISAAIDLISDAGLGSLNMKNISMRVNLTEAMIYKYYGDVNELLLDVVDAYFKFDKGIFHTIESKKDFTYLDKIRLYVDSYAEYYDSYFALSTICLQYEELLHNTFTRERTEEGIRNRHEFVKGLFQGAIDSGEIIGGFTSGQLANALTGITMMCTLDRRINLRRIGFKVQVTEYIDRWLKLISVEK